MSAEARETAPDAAVASLAPEAPRAAAGLGAMAGLAPQQRLALQLQGAGGNAGVARILARSTGPTIAREPAAAPAGSAPAAGAAVDTSLIPDFVLDMIRAIPGYGVATLVAGTDPLTGAPVRLDRKALVEQLLGHGPFAAGVGPVLSTLDVLDEVFAVISDGLASHRLTMSRIWADITAAWEEVSVSNAPSTNVAIVERYLNAFIADVRGFVTEIADRLITMVREAAVEAAEPFLQRPEIAPVWNLARKVMHYDPLRDEEVSAPTVEILADFMRLIGEEQRLAQMQERGTLQKTADWLDTQAHTFVDLLSQLKSLFADAWSAISPANLPNLLTTLPDLASRALGLMKQVRDFATTVIGTVLKLVKEALLGLLSEHAHKVPGFHLVTVILGRNPFTDEAVPRTAQNLIKGFISLLPGGEQIYDQLAESGVIASAAARIEGAIERLGISWDLITSTFRGIWDTLGLNDLLNPIGAFARIIERFGEPLARIVAFVSEVVQAVVELILAAMNFPSDLLGSIIDNAKRAMEDIKKDPVQFLKNVLMALKDGVGGFLSNIVGYLRDGLVGWLTHGLQKVGVEIPTDWSLGSVMKLVMDVLGIGIDKLWDRLAKKTSPGIVAKIKGGIDKLAGAWEWVKDVMENGISALWKHLQDQLGNLWDTLLGMAKDWIMGELIEKALARLVSMLDPTGVMAIIRSAQAFFNAIQSAIEYLRDILAIVNDYVSTLAAVAAGNISAGASKLEKGLAKGIPIALGFLANQVGITDVPEKIAEIIGKLREMIDKALDWLVDKAWEMGKSALSALGIGGKDEPAEDQKDGKPAGDDAPTVDGMHAGFHEGADGHNVIVEASSDGTPQLEVHSTPQPFDAYLAHVRTHLTAVPEAKKAEANAALAAVEQLGGKIKALLPKARTKAQATTTAQGAAAAAAGSADREQERTVATEVQRLIAEIAASLEKVNGLVPGLSSPKTVPAKVVAAIDREAAKYNAQTTAARKAAGADAAEITARERLANMVSGLQRSVAGVNKATGAADAANATAELRSVRQGTVDYLEEVKRLKADPKMPWAPGRVAGMGAKAWGDAKPGEVSSYGRTDAPGQLKEHVIPASVAAGLTGKARTDAEFKAVDDGLTTLTWPRPVADLKTNGHVTIGGQDFHLVGHKGDNQAGGTSAGLDAAAAGKGTGPAFEQRLGAAIAAADVLRSADATNNAELREIQRQLPSSGTIRAAAMQEWNTMWELLAKQQAPPKSDADAAAPAAAVEEISAAELDAAFAEWPEAPAAAGA